MPLPKIAFFTPYLTQQRGNSVTAQRIVHGLRQQGLDVVVFPYLEQPLTEDVEAELNKSDLFHILHFTRFLNWQKESGFVLNKPYILTNGGTDINVDIQQHNPVDGIVPLLRNAAAITVFTNDAKQKLIAFLRDVRDKIYKIEQSVWFPPSQHAATVELPKGEPTFLLPAGLRAIKDVLYLEKAFISLQELFPRLQFVIAGAVLEQQAHAEVEKFVTAYPWATFIGEIPFEQMPNIYKWADYVINTSKEEGQSTALLEAMYFNAVVLARSNGGNESIIEQGVNGYLFASNEEFVKLVTNLEENYQKQRNLRENAQKYVQLYHCLTDEIHAYVTLYDKISK